ncbi:glycosyltransferase family 2 protein [Galbibacter mesophilus]|uniref:glycosyltransferase family 2 protein n=1 Tax=Galbibacter mesophilus TaxID=379069 RepID=UPI00191D7CAA|nr:glycosyltransferase family 2 protein [Galbibacter mesophilus]MCM5663482.1 glycosyltransferase family 2 protein [Galbibacter mesophilus]
MLTGSIVVYNNNLLKLRKSIESFLGDREHHKLFLIDNSPTDYFRNLFSSSDDRIIYIHNGENIGFGAGHNIAISKASQLNSNYHVILNPDVFFDTNVLDNLINFMQSNKDIGLVMPKVLYPDGSLQYLCKLLPRPVDLFLRFFFVNTRMLNKNNEVFELQKSGYNRIMNVPYLSGCFMFCRKNILNEIHGFDERFFMYFEDVDISRRINSISRTVYYPDVQIFHHHEKGSFKNFKLLKIHIKSAIKYFNKWGWFFDSERRKINKKTLNSQTFK